ncbi:MAG TPA: dihydropteroate synthase [Sulfurovum sp. UBA12169]|nr:MAG TPA: dihydropteroate synthase [Sulfurovum sp. UBA12169]
MNIYQLGNILDNKAALQALGVEHEGIEIMSKKMELFCFYLKDLKTPAVNILKQDALSIGAELAAPSGVITCEKPLYDCILIGTKKHIEILSRKELAQPFGLKNVAKELKKFLSARIYPLQIMGIINTNDDSFFEGSRFVAQDALLKCQKMIDEGASIIDIGPVSSRPGSQEVSEEEELERVKPLCDAIKAEKLYKKATFSIDSYTPLVVEYALQSGFALINDITGASNDELIKLALKYDAKLCIMHMQGTPQMMQENPHYEDVMTEVSDFFEARIAKCEALGLSPDKLILDVGIGFGKTLEHNLVLLKNLTHFKKFGCELLIGASRKSMIDKIISAPIPERLPGTLAIHLKAVENGASIIRCHDVGEHRQALKVFEAMR